MRRRSARLGPASVWWTSLAWVSLLLLLGASDGSLQGMLFESDQLYIPTLVDDVLYRSGSFQDWALTPAPYFFPDMLMYAALHAVVPRAEWTIYLSSILLFWMTMHAARHLVANVLRQPFGIAALMGPAFVLWLALRPHIYFVQALFLISSHGSAVWMTLVTLALCFRTRERLHQVWTGFAALFAWACGVSDPLYVVSCSLPLGLLAAPGLYARLQRGNRQTWQLWGVLPDRCMAGTVGGVAGLLTLRHFRPNEAQPALGLQQAVDTWARLQRDLEGPAHKELLLIVSIVLVAISTLVWLRHSAADARLRMFAGWLLASVAASYAALLGTGFYVDFGSLRYLVVPHTLGFVLICSVVLRLTLGRAHESARTHVLAVAAAITLLGVITTGMVSAATLQRGHYAAPMRASAACVQALAEREASRFVLADYWMAKPLLLFSEGRVRALQVVGRHLKPRWWISSRASYLEVDADAVGVVVTNELDPGGIRHRYGEPAALERCGELELVVYRGRARTRISAELRKSAQRLWDSP